MAEQYRPILCVDFDGVIHSYTSGWKGAEVIPDPPVPGALEWLEKAQAHWRVHIYSSRSKEREGRAAMREWLRVFATHEFCDVERAQQLVAALVFSHDKPAAVMTIDDRCTRFDGDWSDPSLDPEAMLKFRPWNKR